MSARPREDLRVKDACIPDFVVDPRTHKKYKKGRFLGKVRYKLNYLEFSFIKIHNHSFKPYLGFMKFQRGS